MRRLVIGVDPGATGALAFLLDREPIAFIDVPTINRAAGGQMVDPHSLADDVRKIIDACGTVYVLAIFELVQAMPDQSANSGFRFGQSDGMIRGALGALRIPWCEVTPVVWKRALDLLGHDHPKKAAIEAALDRYPQCSKWIHLVKHADRAEALLLAHYGSSMAAQALEIHV